MKEQIKKVTTRFNRGKFGNSYVGTLMNPEWEQQNYYSGNISVTEYDGYGRTIKRVYSFDKDLNLIEIRDETDRRGYKISKFRDNELVEFIDYGIKEQDINPVDYDLNPRYGWY